MNNEQYDKPVHQLHQLNEKFDSVELELKKTHNLVNVTSWRVPVIVGAVTGMLRI